MKRLKQIFATLFATIAAVTVQAEPVAITQNLSSGDFVSSYGRDGKMLFENTLVIEPSKDINGDGAINVGDVNYVLNLILNEAYEKKPMSTSMTVSTWVSLTQSSPTSSLIWIN